MTIETELKQRLQTALSPVYLEVVNESYMHNVPRDAETHFKVIVASEGFAGSRKVQRHQQIYALVSDLLAGPMHALALHTYTPEEWLATGAAPASPNCRGGESV